MSNLRGHRIIFPAKSQVRFEEFEVPEIKDEEILVRSICSLVSTGTEMTAFNGTFDPGTHWDRYVVYPFKPGYSMIGRVEKIGPRVNSWKIGGIVGLRKSHASHHVVLQTDAYAVPAGLDLRQAAWFALGKITYVGAKAAQYKLGESAIIVGCGPIGQLAVRWAAQCGLRHLCVIDSAEERLKLALEGGATAAIGLPVAQAKDRILELCGGVMPGTITDTTGNPAVFGDVQRLSAIFGRIVLLGDAGSPDSQHLTSDLIRKGLTVTGAHDGHIEFSHQQSGAVYELFFKMLVEKRIDVSNLITHRVKPKDCESVYQMLNQRRQDTMGVIFDWEG